MCFTYTFRDNTGARCEATVEAASREAAFAALKADGISPLSIREGGKVSPRPPTVSRRRDGSKKDNTRKPFAVLFCLLVAIAAIAAIALWYATRDEKTIPANNEASDTGKRVIRVPSSVSNVTSSTPKVSRSVPPPKIPKKQKVGANPTSPLPTTTETTEATEPEPPQQNSPTGRIARTAAEELLMLATPSRPGGLVPPLPDISHAQIEQSMTEALKRTVTVEEGDDENRLERKLLLTQQKEEFRELKRDGWKFADYLNALREKNNADADYLRDAHRTLNELYNDESVSDEEYKNYREKVNETLKERGLPEIE